MITLIFIVDLIVLFICEIFFRQDFTNSNSKISKAILNIFYSGFLASYLCRLTTFEYSTILICFFVITVFLSDSAAWLFGMTFGKNNRGLIAASPNKSAAGFSGGCLVSILTCVIAQKNWPEILTGPLYKSVLLGFLCNYFF